MFELVFVTGSRAGEVVAVKSSLMAGRSPDCSLEVPDPNASRQHARVVYDGTGLTLVDNRSANGTFLNEKRLTEPVRLKHDDVFRLGETRIRIQAKRGQTEAGSESVFGFHDSEADLSQSIVMPMSELVQSKSPDASDRRFTGLLKAMNLSKDIDKLDRVLEGIIEVMFDLFPQAERGFLMLGDKAESLQPKSVKLRNSAGTPDAPKISTSICRKALNERAAFLFNESNPGDFDQGMSIVSLKIRSAMTVPLVVDSDVLGLLQVDTTDRAKAFTSKDLEMAAAVSQVASFALRNSQQLVKLEAQRRTRDNLCRFLPGPLAQQVLDGKLDINPGGKTFSGTVLFSDVVGFTRMSEAMSAEQVVDLMNKYFERMVPCIRNERGSIDKFIGDAIMGFWGVPIEQGNSAIEGCTSALHMQIAMLGFNSLAKSENRPVIGHGIGLNTGPVVAGNIGSSDQLSYTLLGDTVNTASRIEHHALKEQVLVSQATWEALAGAGYGIRMPPVHVRNKNDALSLSALRGLVRDTEVILFLPVDSGGVRCWLIRRLSDRSFIMLHPASHDPSAHPMASAAVEWPGIALGTPSTLASLPAQNADGTLSRTQIGLTDETLGGLIGPNPIPCPMGWDALVR